MIPGARYASNIKVMAPNWVNILRSMFVNKIDNQVYFLYDKDENDSRDSRLIREFLGDFSGSDGYIACKRLAQAAPEYVQIFCWAHVRAKFKYAENISKDEDAP